MIEEVVKQIASLQRQVEGLVKPEVGQWLDWTPTITQNVVVAATVTLARYKISEKTCELEVILSVTGAGTGGSNIVIGGLPTVAQIKNNYAGLMTLGTASVLDSGTQSYIGIVTDNSAATSMIIRDTNTRGTIGNNPNFALANGDKITLNCRYEVA